MTNVLDLKQAHADALARWQTPHPGFASGGDPRTTENALLVLTYGGLAHAAAHDWLNAGRRLIDKTYVDMLWHVQQLTRWRTRRPEQVAADLDDFIRRRIAPKWPALPTDDAGRRALAEEWVEAAARECFGSRVSELGASRLLFFLCPMVPVFNLSRGHLAALRRLGHDVPVTNYADYARAMHATYAEVLPRLRALSRPVAAYGDPTQRAAIDGLLATSDWWERRVFDVGLRALVDDSSDGERWFACDDSGGLG